MPFPVLPVLAFGGVVLALAARSPRPNAHPSAPPSPAPPPPRPSDELIDPWADPSPAAPVTPAPRPLPSPPPTPAPLPVAPSPARPAPVVSVPAEIHDDDQVIRDVNDVLTSPQEPAPVAPAPPAPPAPIVAPAPPPAPKPVRPGSPVVTPPPPPRPTQPVVVAPPPAPIAQPSPAPIATLIPEPTTPAVEPPAGFNPLAARAQAPRVAANLKKGRDHYSRPTLLAWQALAGIDADGIYGGESAGALAFYLKGQPTVAPRPFFKPTTPAPYRWAALIEQAFAQGAAVP